METPLHPATAERAPRPAVAEVHQQAAPAMPVPQGVLLCLGILLLLMGGFLALFMGRSPPLLVVGLFLVLMGVSLLVAELCMAMKNLQVAVPGHFLLHPRTGTRFSPQQALSIQRRLDRIRREISEDSVCRRPEPEAALPSTPPPWTMEPPPSYDTVMKIQENAGAPAPQAGKAANSNTCYQLSEQ